MKADGNQSGYSRGKDPYALLLPAYAETADVGHRDAVCSDGWAVWSGCGAIQCLSARIIPACRAVPGVELGGEYGALSAVSGADGGDYSLHLLAHRDNDRHSCRGGADDRRRGAVLAGWWAWLRELPAEVTRRGGGAAARAGRSSRGAQLSEALPGVSGGGDAQL